MSEPAYGLLWGLKKSFVDYIGRMPDGKGVVSGGAVSTATGEVRYPPETSGRRPGADGGEDRFWLFAGEVRFSGHYGMLSVRIAAPRIVLIGGAASLDVAVPTAADADARLTLVTLRLTPEPGDDGVEQWASTDVALTDAGVALFNDVYRPGEPFDDLRITLPIVE